MERELVTRAVKWWQDIDPYEYMDVYGVDASVDADDIDLERCIAGIREYLEDMDSESEEYSEGERLLSEMEMYNSFRFEYELNRAWVYDDSNEDPIGERNFIVPMKWANEIISSTFIGEQYSNIEDFLDCYEPETNGEFIYQKAKQDNCLGAEFTTIY